MNEEEVKEEVKNKNKSKLIIIILAILVLLLIGVLVYVLLLRKQEEPVNNNSQQNTNETVKLDVDKVSKELIDLISDFGGVMPLKAKGDKPSSYTINDLTKEINSDIILSYALQNISEKDNNICKYDDKYNSVCHIKVSELNTKLGLNIDNNIKTTNYVLGVVKKDNDDYYKVIFPATEWSQEYYVRDCTTTHTDETLTIECDVYEVIEMYDPYEEAKVGIGEFIYNVKDKLAFEKFVFKASSTSNTKEEKTEKIKISNNTLYINGKKVTDVEFGHLAKDYVYDLGDLILVSYCVSHCENYFINEKANVVGTIGKLEDSKFNALISPKYSYTQILEVKGKDLYIWSYNYNTQDASSVCDRSKDEEVSITEKYTYNGNGKFSNPETINSSTVANLFDNGWAKCD